VRQALFAIAALAALAAAAPSHAQQLWEVEKYQTESFGTYQCGPEHITVDKTWKATGRVWDGHHFEVVKTMADRRDFVFGFPVHGNGNDEMFARGEAPRYTLSVFYWTNDYSKPMQEQGTYDCGKQ